MKGTSIHLQKDSYQKELKKSKFENLILRLTYTFFISHSEKFLKNKTINCADIGCGAGRFARTFLISRRKNSKIIGRYIISIKKNE